MARLVGTVLVLLGCGGILLLMFLLCRGANTPALEELLGGNLNGLGIAFVGSIVANVVGGVMLAWSTRADRAAVRGEIDIPVGQRPGWVVVVLMLAVLVPISAGLWFGLLCVLFQ